MTKLSVTSPHTTSQSHAKSQWEEIGAWGAGTVVGVALDLQAGVARGLLASGAGVYGWTQSGANVEQVVEPLAQGLSDPNVVAVAFATGNDETPSTALVATATGRLFRSIPMDEANIHEHWEEIRSWAGLGAAVVLVPSPSFGDDQTIFIGTSEGIFRTQDDGQSWESCNFGLLDEDVLCLACAPDFAESELLWAGTAGGGLYRSRNSGRAWRDSGSGLPDAAVQSLAASPNFREDRTLFAGMEAQGLFTSRDGGETWSRLALGEQSVNTLACAETDLLWAGTEDGLWRIVPSRGEAVQVTGAGEVVLAVAATASGAVAVGLFGSGLWISQEGKGQPQAFAWQKPEVALHAPPVVVRVGTDLIALDADGSIALAQDRGARWSEMPSASMEGVFALAGGTVAGGKVARDDGTGATEFFAATGSGLSRWDNTQGMWQEVASDAFHDRTALGVELSPAFAVDQTLLVVAHDSVLLLSQDGGATWQGISASWQGQSLLRAHFGPNNPQEILALTVQPTDTGHFTLTVWHTLDLGQKWEVLAGFTSGVPAVMMAWPQGTGEQAIFLATQHRVLKLYHQNDPSALQVHQHFFDETVSVTALSPAPDYADSDSVWAATTGGIYRSVDRGMSWELMLEVPQGLPVVWLDVTLTHLYAITLGGRAWCATL